MFVEGGGFNDLALSGLHNFVLHFSALEFVNLVGYQNVWTLPATQNQFFSDLFFYQLDRTVIFQCLSQRK